MSFNRPRIKLEKNRMHSLFLDQVELKELKELSSFHQNIQSHKAKLVNCYTSNPDFAEIIRFRNHSDIKKKQKKKVFTLIQPRQSQILLLKANKSSRNKHFNLPKLPSTNQNKSISNTIKSQNKESNSYNEINEQSHANFPLVKNYSHQNLNRLTEIDKNNKLKFQCLLNMNVNNKGELFKRIKPQIIITNKLNNRLNELNSSQLKQRNKLRNIYLKCQSEITRGQSIDNYINKSTEKLHKKIDQIHESKKNITTINSDKIIINEEKKKKGKYDILCAQNIAIMKRRINQQVSEGLAYSNKTELMKRFNECKYNAYSLYLVDLMKEEKAKRTQRLREDYQLDLITTILDKTVKDKEILKAKIDIKDEMYKNENYITSFFDKTKTKVRKRNYSQQDIFTEIVSDRETYDLIEKEVYDEIKPKYNRKKTSL